MIKNILLTGSGGFIGKNLKEFLQSKYSLFCPRSFELDLHNKESVDKYLDKNEIDLIIHSASCGVRIHPDATMEDVAKPNIEMFKNLAEFTNKKRKMITFGSGAEYDKSKPLIKVKEDDFDKTIPKDPYGYSKYLISKEIEKMDNVLNLRLFGIYGYGEDNSRVTAYIIKQNLKKQPIILNQNVIFDFIWIEDFCSIVEFFIKNEIKEKFINVAPTESIEIVKLAEIVNDISDFKSEIIMKNEGFNNEYTGDNSLLKKEIKDLTFTSYENGLHSLYENLSSHI